MKENLPIRKNIRLKFYDYSEEGIYFITICTKNRIELLGKIRDNKDIKLSKEGFLSEQYIKSINNVFNNVIVDEYVIMPNHIHMLLVIKDKNDINISRIIKQYKMQVSKKIGYSIWQKSFYEHVVRNEKEYYIINEYIQNNVINWQKDKYF